MCRHFFLTISCACTDITCCVVDSEEGPLQVVVVMMMMVMMMVMMVVVVEVVVEVVVMSTMITKTMCVLISIDFEVFVRCLLRGRERRSTLCITSMG